jgi:hypothetical protein
VVENGPLWVPNIAAGDGDDVPAYYDPTDKQIKRQPSSSARYKENIVDIQTNTSNIYKLRPVSFTYRGIEVDDDADPAHKGIGLIAEEVQEVFPELVIHNQEGSPEGVAYDKLPILMLAEIIKLNRRVEELERQIGRSNAEAAAVSQ